MPLPNLERSDDSRPIELPLRSVVMQDKVSDTPRWLLFRRPAAVIAWALDKMWTIRSDLSFETPRVISRLDDLD
jgi:hypothetical protein